MQYLALIHANQKILPSAAEWEHFFTIANASGLFEGGSAVANGVIVGERPAVVLSTRLGGYMRFDADDGAAVLELLQHHPVIRHGGTIELLEMLKD